MTDNLLTVADVMARLAISRRTVYRLIDSGALPPLKIGKAVRFQEADVAAYIASLTTAR